jgi:hypothetical protein
MKYTIVKRINDTNHLVLNEHGFPYMIKDQHEAELVKIEEQMVHDEPVLVYATTLGV